VIGVVVAELGLLVVLLLAFVAGYSRGPWRATPVGRHLMAMAGVSLAEALGLLVLATGHAPPLWVYVVVYGLADAVVVGWLVLLWRARRRAALEVEET
jgi:hypothetical protein